MEWKDLSEEAKGIIEWLVSPITNQKQTIEIKIGNVFHTGVTGFVKRGCNKPLNTGILVTKKLYREVLKYISLQENIQYEQLNDNLIFRLKDEIEV